MIWKCPPLHLPNWNHLWKWKEEMNTCDKCENWRREELQDTYLEYKDQGYCKLFGDSYADIEHNNRCYAEGDGAAGVLVMAKFGCIHWEDKNG